MSNKVTIAGTASLFLLCLSTHAAACPDGQHEVCDPTGLVCVCAPNGPSPPDLSRLDPFRQQQQDLAGSLVTSIRESVSTVADLPRAVESGASSVAEAVSRAQQVADSAKDLAKQAADAATNAATDVARQAAKQAEILSSQAADIVRQVVEAGANVATSSAGAAERTANEAARVATASAESATRFASDLAVMVAYEGLKVAENAVLEAEAAAKLAQQYAEQAKSDAARTIAQAAEDAAAAASEVSRNAEAAIAQAGRDVAWNLSSSGGDIVDAGKAILRFSESQVSGLGETLTDAERRLKEGKIVDAFWEAAIDRARRTDRDAAAAIASSNVLRAAAQTAATAYGGPAGAAAFAAWYTYHTTGNADLALRVGLLQGIAGSVNPAAVETSTIAGTLKKAAMSGAMAGLTVAAAGGDAEAVGAAFAEASQAVIIEAGTARVQTALSDAYCMGSADPCTLPDPDQIKQKAGRWVEDRAQEAVGWNVADLRVPGADAVTLLQGQYVLAWDPEVLKQGVGPANVLSYIGKGSPYYDQLQGAVAQGTALHSSDIWPTGATAPDAGADFIVELIAQDSWMPVAFGVDGIKTFMCVTLDDDQASRHCYGFFMEPQLSTVHLGPDLTVRRVGASWHESPSSFNFTTFAAQQSSLTLFDRSRNFWWQLPIPRGVSSWKQGDGPWHRYHRVTSANASTDAVLLAGGVGTRGEVLVPESKGTGLLTVKLRVSSLQKRALLAAMDGLSSSSVPPTEAASIEFVTSLAKQLHLKGANEPASSGFELLNRLAAQNAGRVSR